MDAPPTPVDDMPVDDMPVERTPSLLADEPPLAGCDDEDEPQKNPTKKPTKKTARKDAAAAAPNAPRAKAAYDFFCADHRPTLLSQGIRGLAELSSECGKAWRRLNDDDPAKVELYRTRAREFNATQATTATNHKEKKPKTQKACYQKWVHKEHAHLPFAERCKLSHSGWAGMSDVEKAAWTPPVDDAGAASADASASADA